MSTLLTLLSVWVIIGFLFLKGWIKFNKELIEPKQIIDNQFKKATMYEWIEKDGIKPDTKIYEFPNGMSAMHDKTLNRLYVYTKEGMPAQAPIDTTSITVLEFEETLLGIEKR